MNEPLAATTAAAAAIAIGAEHPLPPQAQPSLGGSILPSPRCPRAPRLLPEPCLLTPGLGCPPSARELITEGKNSDKGLKIACHDGKHFVERSVDKRGNRAVKKIGGEGHRGRNGADTGLTATIWEGKRSGDGAWGPARSHGQPDPSGWSSLSLTGPHPVLCHLPQA